MQERHYSATSLIWTNSDMEYDSLTSDISFESFIGFIKGKLKEIKV